MRWRTEKPALPKDGETRERKKFAWKPFNVGTHTVWLEFYGYQERYFQPSSGNPGWWSVERYYTLDYYY